MPRPILKRILWSALAVIAAFTLLVVWTFSQLPRMSKVPRLEPAPGVVGVEAGGSYVWVIRTPHGAALIDAGMDAQGKAILEELDREHLNSANVNTIFVTHGHRDHIGALAAFPIAKIWVGPGDAELIRGERKSKALMARLAAKYSPKAPPAPRLDDLEGLDKVDFDGERMQIIHTPGHTPGSTMYLYKNILFTGDSLFANKNGLIYPPRFICDDPAANRASIPQLKNFSFDIIADGHTGFTTNAHEKLLQFLAR
jgi:glyoxylase-like metal-dependent hydrolase (beta-lactamase superfamily II)